MQRLVAFLVLALVAGPQLSAAHKQGLIHGKGKMYGGKGKGGDVNVDVQCQQACKDECYPIPQKVCNDVPYQTQACQKVPVTLTKQKCERVCTTTSTTTETIATGKGKGMAIPVSVGKGRRLFGKDSLIHKHKMMGMKGAAIGKGYIAAASYGKGAMPQVDTNCQDICNDVPYTTWQNDCKTITKTKTMCDIVYQQQCQKVCKPVCQKVTTVTTTQTISTGKGMPVMMGKGR